MQVRARLASAAKEFEEERCEQIHSRISNTCRQWCIVVVVFVVSAHDLRLKYSARQESEYSVDGEVGKSPHSLETNSSDRDSIDRGGGIERKEEAQGACSTCSSRIMPARPARVKELTVN